MQTPGMQYPNQYAAQPGHNAGACWAKSDSNIVMGLGVVLLCFGQAITGSHTVTMIGLAMIVLSGWLD
jgi:hypothetical protein